MRPFDRFAERVGGLEEIGPKRRVNSKTFRTAPGRFKLIQTFCPLHWDDGERLNDIDLTPRDMGDHWLIDQAPYILKIDKDGPGFEYRSRRGGFVKARLAVPAAPGRLAAGGVEWDVAQDTAVKLVVRPGRVQVQTVLKSPAALHDMEWDVEEGELPSHPFRRSMRAKGYDAQGRALEIENVETPGKARHVFRGLAQHVADKRTRRREPRPAAYPVTLDPVIEENITVNEDDVSTYGAGLNVNGYYGFLNAGFTTGGSPYEWFGLRFQTLAVPQGATINGAAITWDVFGEGQPSTFKIFGDDVDDAPPWGTSSLPQNITKTTAETAIVNDGPRGVVSEDITGIVQEIVNRGGWASGNDMRFAVFPATFDTDQFFGIYDYSEKPEATFLEVDYGAAATFTPRMALMGVG